MICVITSVAPYNNFKKHMEELQKKSAIVILEQTDKYVICSIYHLVDIQTLIDVCKEESDALLIDKPLYYKTENYFELWHNFSVTKIDTKLKLDLQITIYNAYIE